MDVVVVDLRVLGPLKSKANNTYINVLQRLLVEQAHLVRTSKGIHNVHFLCQEIWESRSR